MITTNILIGGVLFIVVFALVRFLMRKKQPASFEQELTEILNNEDCKVKGRFESRPVERTE